MKQLEFAGLVCMNEPKFSVEDKFKVVDECGDETYLVSKQIFHHEEEELDFWYQYVVGITNMDEYDSDNEQNMIVNLYLVPTPSSLYKTELKKIIADCGYGDDYEPTVVDIVESTIPIVMGRKFWTNHDIEDVLEDEEVKHTLLSIANVIEVLDRLKAFTLDHPHNMLGTTGWMFIEALVNGKDWFDETMKKYGDK